MLLLCIGLHPLMLVVIIIFSILFTLNKRFSWLSSAYTYGFTAIALLFYPYYQAYLPSLLDQELTQLDWIIFTTLMGVFLVIEGLMISAVRSEEHTSELQSRGHLVCRLL